MLVKYNSSTEERRLKEQSHMMFEEVSSGIFHVKKDRTGQYKGYTGLRNVIFALNNEDKVAVAGLNGTYANFGIILWGENMTGKELFEHVFDEFYTQFGDFYPYEIEDLDEATCYEENLSYHDGWYIVTEISFRFRGKKYAFDRKDHTSDNVSDTTYLIDTFHEVVSTSELDKAIDKIIEGIEEQTIGTLEELVKDLEDIKRKFHYLNEV